MAEVVLRCDGLRKRFGDLVAVDDLSFTITEGETYGLLGPNGAGKTTSISMMVGVLARDAGAVTIDGEPVDVHRTAVKRLIGYVPQQMALYPDLTAAENLRFFGRLYGLSGAALRQRVAEVLDVVGLADRAKERVFKFSGGMARRLHIGAGLLHRPRLLVLDEPTAGVDPQSRNAILDSVQQLAGTGVAVLYTTHYIEEAERLCDRVGIIDGGRLRAEGTRRELITMVGGHDEVRLGVDGDLAAITKALAMLPGVSHVDAKDSGIQLLAIEAGSLLPDILGAAGRAGAVIRSVEVTEPNLEAVFLHLTGKALRD
ncbi:putative ABC transporter ATP-binding protein YfiL [Longispora fulva]|uniref:ABC-2 type transport system ATP-binding protein n=1 Tax=Longispora fulva TaxID=619741 RepID=A0A8J7GPN1_9ACTN|nr:ABC transporter ATP-binding protein [Longispora fulva]MBG6135613.1 ABC-2 type transport system ATP-binding protein [Longispora fulva]GIG56148.1 putative ABC transporter ATP-binding protein YfiL [Longispora fulva]